MAKASALPLLALALQLAPLIFLAAASAGAAATAGDDCTSIQSRTVGGATEYSLVSHESYGHSSKHPNNMNCTWHINASASGSTWQVTFHEIILDISLSFVTGPCGYDNLTVSYKINQRAFVKVLCGMLRNLTLLTNDSFQLEFKSDRSDNHEGFNVTWRSISRTEAVDQIDQISPDFLTEEHGIRQCKSIESLPRSRQAIGSRRYSVVELYMSGNSYLHNADCRWIINAPYRMAVYMTFDRIQLESSSLCKLNNITVTYRLVGRTQNQSRTFCTNRNRLTLASVGTVTLRLRTDFSDGTEGRFDSLEKLSVKWFAAPIDLSQTGEFLTSLEFKQEQCPELESGPRGGKIRLYYEPPLTYESRMSCSWEVPIPADKMASFFFSQFQLARGRFSRRYNTDPDNCSYGDDFVRITYREMWTQKLQNLVFCQNSNIQLQKTLLSVVATPTVFFKSNEYRNSHGFILEWTLAEVPTPGPAICPALQQLDNNRQQIINASSDQSPLYGRKVCSWILRPSNEGHMISLMVRFYTTWRYQNPFYNDYGYHRYPDRRMTDCDPKVIVTSESYVGDNALLAVGDTAIVNHFRQRYCSPLFAKSVGLFSGAVNVSVIARGTTLSLRGFALVATKIPKPQKGCSNVNVTTEHYNSAAVKVFTITGKAGCVTLEGLVDQLMNPNITIRVVCKNSASSELLEVFSESAVENVKCGSTKILSVMPKRPVILKFPVATDATVTFRVTYGFPVMEAACQRLNSKPAANVKWGTYLLPLFFDANDGDMQFYHGMYGMISCTYNLHYRPGYSIRLKIGHNLDNYYLDEFCHLKNSDRKLNPHIVLTVNQRDPDDPGTWMEQQQEMCHGHLVGSLGILSDMLIDGSLSISLLALTGQQQSIANGTGAGMVMGLYKLLNKTMPQRLQFFIKYEYVPSCPELACRDKKGRRSGCQAGRISDIQLEADLMASEAGQSCTLNIASSGKLKSVMARLSGNWLATVEITNFAISCPCHNCDADDTQEFITVGPIGNNVDPGSEKVVVCGNYANSTKAVTMPLPRNSDIQISYNLYTVGATVRVTFVDCQLNSELSHCKILAALFQNQSLMQAGINSHGGLLFATVLLAAILIGCLLFLNRHSLMSGFNRIRRDTARPRVGGSRTDDTLQLTQESAGAL